MFDYFFGLLSHDVGIDLGTANTLVHVKGRVIVIREPSGVTEVERRAVQEAALSAGARQCFLIEEPMAAAIGAQLPIDDAGWVMVVDIGGGTSEMAVISLGGIVLNKSIRIAGDEMDEAIVHYMRLKYNILLGE